MKKEKRERNEERLHGQTEKGGGVWGNERGKEKVEEKREEKEGEKTEPPKPPSTSAMKQMLGHESESLVERHSYPKIKKVERE